MVGEKYLQQRDAIRARVRALPGPAQVAFAAACAERLVGTYDDYCVRTTQAPVLRAALDEVWATVLRERSPASADDLAAREREWLRSAVPQDGEARDAANAILYAVRALQPESSRGESAFYSADTVLNAIIAHVKNRLGVTDYGPRYDEEVLKHPEVLGELERQTRDLSALEAQGGMVDAALVETMRTQAKGEGVRLVPVPRRAEPFVNPFTGKSIPRG